MSNDVAVLGTGLMGAPTALKLGSRGLRGAGWNRTPKLALVGGLAETVVFAETVKAQLDAAVAAGHGDEDMAATLYACKGDQ